MQNKKYSKPAIYNPLSWFLSSEYTFFKLHSKIVLALSRSSWSGGVTEERLKPRAGEETDGSKVTSFVRA